MWLILHSNGLPVPVGEAPFGPFLEWPPNKNNGGAKPGLNLVKVVIGVSLVLSSIVGCLFLSVASQRPEQPPEGLDPQKQAAYFMATKQLGDLITRQDPVFLTSRKHLLQNQIR